VKFMLCGHKDVLFAAYNTRVRDWATSVHQLANRAATIPGVYVALLTLVEEAKARTADAKAMYEKHRHEHGC